MVNPLPDGRPNPNVLCCLPRPASMISQPNILEVTSGWKVVHDSPYPRVVIPITNLGTLEAYPLQKNTTNETNDVYRGLGSGTLHRLIIPTGGPFMLKASIAGRVNIIDCPVPEVLSFYASPALSPAAQPALSMVAPTTVVVGVASTLVLAANPARRALWVGMSKSATGERVSFAFDGAAAVLDSGLTFYQSSDGANRGGLGPNFTRVFIAPEAAVVGEVRAIGVSAAATAIAQEAN